MAKLSPVFNDQTFTVDGDPAVGYKLFTYAAGSSTKLTTFSEEGGTIPNSNPIILNNDGWPTQGPIWLTEGRGYKFVLALPTDTDPPTSPIKTIDNVTGVGDNTVSISQWVNSGTVGTYVTPTSFTVPGDQTTEFHLGRMLELQITGGTVYGKIVSSAYVSQTTITLQMTPGQVLDNGLSTVNLSILRADNQALPNPIEFMRASVAAATTSTPLWNRAYGEVQDWTGVVAITGLPAAPRPGATRVVFPAAGTSIANNVNITVQGGALVTAAAGDKWIITAVTLTTFYVQVIKRSGKAAVSASDLQLLNVVMAANAVTITLNPTSFDFRSATLGSGVINTRVISAALTAVISSGSTLGTINTAPSRILVLVMDVPGVGQELAFVNQSCGINLDESALISTTAEGGAGAADSATIIYSATARANVPFRIAGFFDSVQAVAGTWATAASTIQGVGGNSLANMDTRVPQNVTASRALGTTYTNGPMRRKLSVTAYSASGGQSLIVTTQGVAIVIGTMPAAANNPATGFMEIVPFAQYNVSMAASPILVSWYES